jgi:hypothetical protein
MYISKEVGCGTFKFPIPRYPVTVKGNIPPKTATGQLGRPAGKLALIKSALKPGDFGILASFGGGGSVWSRSFFS